MLDRAKFREAFAADVNAELAEFMAELADPVRHRSRRRHDQRAGVA